MEIINVQYKYSSKKEWYVKTDAPSGRSKFFLLTKMTNSNNQLRGNQMKIYEGNSGKAYSSATKSYRYYIKGKREKIWDSSQLSTGMWDAY